MQAAALGRWSRASGSLGFRVPIAGFGLWPGMHIVPHFDEIPSVAVSLVRRVVGRDIALVGVNVNTALVNVGGTYCVMGDQVTVWTATQRREYGQGELPADALRR